MLYLPAPLRDDGVSVTGVKVVAASVVVADVQENHKKHRKILTQDNDINLGNIQLHIFSLSNGVLVQSAKRMDLHSYALLFDYDGPKHLVQQARIQAVSAQIEINNIGCSIFI